MSVKKQLQNLPLVQALANKTYRKWKAAIGYARLRRRVANPPVNLVIGAAGVFGEGWIGTDIGYLNLLNPTHWERVFKKNTIDAILAEHVWEHLSIEDGLTAARRCFEYIKPGGYLRLAVPDGFHPDPDYIETVKVDGTGHGAEDHKVLYTYQTIGSLLRDAGFQVEFLEYFDSNGDFHFVDWNPSAGKVHRSKRFDHRNRNGELNYTSIIVDAHKPSAA
jgi:predicted SAM-dependent methyltransferase